MRASAVQLPQRSVSRPTLTGPIRSSIRAQVPSSSCCSSSSCPGQLLRPSLSGNGSGCSCSASLSGSSGSTRAVLARGATSSTASTSTATAAELPKPSVTNANGNGPQIGEDAPPEAPQGLSNGSGQAGMLATAQPTAAAAGAVTTQAPGASVASTPAPPSSASGLVDLQDVDLPDFLLPPEKVATSQSAVAATAAATATVADAKRTGPFPSAVAASPPVTGPGPAAAAAAAAPAAANGCSSGAAAAPPPSQPQAAHSAKSTAAAVASVAAAYGAATAAPSPGPTLQQRAAPTAAPDPAAGVAPQDAGVKVPSSAASTPGSSALAGAGLNGQAASPPAQSSAVRSPGAAQDACGTSAVPPVAAASKIASSPAGAPTAGTAGTAVQQPPPSASPRAGTSPVCAEGLQASQSPTVTVPSPSPSAQTAASAAPLASGSGATPAAAQTAAATPATARAATQPAAAGVSTTPAAPVPPPQQATAAQAPAGSAAPGPGPAAPTPAAAPASSSGGTAAPSSASPSSPAPSAASAQTPQPSASAPPQATPSPAPGPPGSSGAAGAPQGPHINSLSSGFQLKPVHVLVFGIIFVGGALFASITLSFTKELAWQTAMQTVARKVAKSVAFRQLCVIACAIVLVRFGLNNVLKALAHFSSSPVQWDKTKIYYILREVYQPLELLLFIAGVCTIADAFVPQLIAVPKSTVSSVVRSTLSVSFILGAATVVFNLKSRFCKENAWQSEMMGDVTAQRRWEAYDKLGTFVIYAVTAVLGIQALGLEVTSVLAIGGIGGLAIGLAGREICENILNGFLIMSTAPFEVGDEVHFFHSNKIVEGMVLDIGWYRTTIRSYEREVFVIPNAVFSKNIVLNITRKNREWRFFEFICVRVADVHKVNAIIQDIRRIVRNDSRIITKLHRRIFLDKITREECRIYVSFYVEASNREAFMAVKQDLLLAFVDCVERNGAKLAVPRTTLDVEPEATQALAPMVQAAAVGAYAATMNMNGGGGGGSGGKPRELPEGRTIETSTTTVSKPSAGSGEPTVVTVNAGATSKASAASPGGGGKTAADGSGGIAVGAAAAASSGAAASIPKEDPGGFSGLLQKVAQIIFET